MLHALISIWTIAALAIFAGVVTRRKICPICVGVFLTWLWMLAGYYLFGYDADIRILALLMGGSVVGAAYTIEKRLSPSRSPGLWKLVVVPVGFVAAYGVLVEKPLLVIAGIAVLLIVGWYFLGTGREGVESENTAVKKLEDQLKNCC